MKSNDSIHSLLFDLMFLIQIEMKKVVKNTDEDLSPIEILVLRTLVEDGETTQQQLAQSLAKDKSQVTRLIQSLEKKKLILKHRNINDKRSFVVSAKNNVKEKMEEFIAHEKKLVQSILKGASSKEKDNMQSLLKLMRDNLKLLQNIADKKT